MTVFDGQEDAGDGRKSPAVCRKGKPPPAVLLFFSICCPLQPRPEQEPAGRRAEHPPGGSWGCAWGRCARDRRDGWCLSRRFLGRRSLTRGCAGTALAGAVNGTPGLDRSCYIQAGHHRWAELSRCPNLSSVLLLFCSLCLTNSLGFSWFLFQLLPPFCCFSCPSLCCFLLPGPPVPPNLQPDTLPIQVAPKVFWLAACLPDSGLKHSLCGWVAPEFTQTATGRGWQQEHSWLGSGCGAGGCGAAPFPSGALCWLILPRCLWAGEGLAGGLLASH